MVAEAANVSEVNAIAEYNRRLGEAIRRADIATLEQLIDSEHVTLAPDQPPLIGREACISIMSNVLQRFFVTETHCGTRTEVDAMLAYQWGDFTTTLVAKSGGHPVVYSGKYLRVYRRRPDGSWIMAVDSFSANQSDRGWDQILCSNETTPPGSPGA